MIIHPLEELNQEQLERMRQVTDELYCELAYLVSSLNLSGGNPRSKHFPDWRDAEMLLAWIGEDEDEEETEGETK